MKIFYLKVGLYILPFALLQLVKKVAWLCLANFQARLTLEASFHFPPHFRCFRGLYSSAEQSTVEDRWGRLCTVSTWVWLFVQIIQIWRTMKVNFLVLPSWSDNLVLNHLTVPGLLPDTTNSDCDFIKIIITRVNMPKWACSWWNTACFSSTSLYMLILRIMNMYKNLQYNRTWTFYLLFYNLNGTISSKMKRNCSAFQRFPSTLKWNYSS